MREELQHPAGGKRKSGRIYFRLALNGILKNGRTYTPYLLTCVGLVTISYIMNYLTDSSQVTRMKGGATLQVMLGLGSGVFSAFAFIFLFYTNSFLIRNRKKEFGLYNILGMGKQNLARVLVWESLLMAAGTLFGGLFCGILFSKLMELGIAKLLESPVTRIFSVETKAVLHTLVLFLVIFAVILLHALVQIGKTKPIDLLHAGSVGEKAPKANWMLAVLGLILLGVAYYMAVTIEDPMSAFTLYFLAVGLVVAATYLLFIAGSVVLCRLLQKKKSYYYKANHFVSVSSMTYRMKRNGAGLASICVLATMVLVILSAATCLFVGTEGRLHQRYVREIELYQYGRIGETQSWEQASACADDTLEAAGLEAQNVLTYRYAGIEGFREEEGFTLSSADMDFGNISDIWVLYFLTIDDYNRIMGTEETLSAQEVLLSNTKSDFHSETLDLGDCGSFSVKKEVDRFAGNGEDISLALNSLCVIVPDTQTLQTLIEAQKQHHPENPFSYTTYYGFDVDAEEQTQIQTTEALQSALQTLAEQNPDTVRTTVECRAQHRSDFYGLYGGIFVLGVLLGVVFLAATVLIMYYKQVTEGYEDQAKFEIMQKVGMTEKEIRSSIRSQMLTVFLAPLLVAGLHTAFDFPIVRKLLLLLGLSDTSLLIRVTAICFVVFTLVYFLFYIATSRAYYRIVSGKKQ